MYEVKTNQTPAQSGEIQKEVGTADIISLEKSAIHIDDEAGELAAQALASGPLDEAASKKVLRKIDLYLLPMLCVTYALQFIDKTSLGYSSVYGIIQDNHLVGQDYSWVSSIFYFVSRKPPYLYKIMSDPDLSSRGTSSLSIPAWPSSSGSQSPSSSRSTSSSGAVFS
jgi:hypothetical protein